MNRNPEDRNFRFIYQQNGRVVRPIFPIFVSIDKNSEKIKVNALLDTGSNKSCVVEDYVGFLGLVSINNNGYVFQGEGKSKPIYYLNFIFSENIVYSKVQVIAIPRQPAIWGSYDVLIGMYILRTGDLSIKSLSGDTRIIFEVKESENKDHIS